MSGVKPRKIAFRADGGPRIGMGHIMRCLALARELQKHNAEVCFISRMNLNVRDLLKKNGCKMLEIEGITGTEELNYVKDIAKKYDICTVITDSYSFDRTYLEAIRDLAEVSAAIDDMNEMVFPSHIVINGNVYAHEMDYRSVYGDTEFLLGPEYLLMREEFARTGSRRIREQVQEILVTVGGSDPLNFTPVILESLSQLNFDFKVNVVLGPGFENLSAIQKAALAVGKQVHLLTNVSNMAELMLSCDVAVTAGGTTLYELARTGTPAVVALQADNQIRAAAGMSEKGTIINLGPAGKITISALSGAIESLCRDFGRRRQMGESGPVLIDGMGAARCAEKILGRA